MEGTLVDPPRDPSCAVCGSDTCEAFHNAPYPDDYPLLPRGPGRGGYDRNGDNNVEPREIAGTRRRKLRCRS